MLEKNTKKTRDRRYYIYYYSWTKYFVTSMISPYGMFSPLLILDNWQDTEKFITFAELFGPVLRRFHE